MSRYIDADALIKHIKNMPWKMTSAAEISKSIFLSTVEEAPTADVVEVVRCKDCVFLSKNADGKIRCANTYGLLINTENEYCSRGERSENGTT